jgi:hypothetical protein
MLFAFDSSGWGGCCVLIHRWGFADFEGPGAAKAVETAVRRSTTGKLALHLGRRVFIRPCLSAPPAALRIKDGASTDTAAVALASRRGKPVPAEGHTAPSDKKRHPPPSDKKHFTPGSGSADSPRAKPGRSERRRHASAVGGGPVLAKDSGKRVAERSG